MGPGATVGVLGTGVPRLACLQPAAWLKGGPSTARLHQHKPKTLARGQASRGGRRGASAGTASSGWLTRGRRDQGGVPHEVPVTQAMTTKGARRVPARAVSSFPLWCKGGKRSRGVPRHHGEAETPTSNQPPRGAQGRRLLGPAALHTCPFASLLSQVQARFGPGGYCRCSGNGGPQTCLRAACSVAQGAAQHGPSSSTQAQDPREGPSLAGWTTRSFLRHGLVRLAHEEAERSRTGVPREVLMTQAMTTKGARRAPARAVSSFPLWCKGSKRRREHKQRHPFRCNETKTSPTAGRKSLSSPSRHHHQSL